MVAANVYFVVYKLLEVSYNEYELFPSKFGITLKNFFNCFYDTKNDIYVRQGSSVSEKFAS